jgi:hypothetical protein
LGGEQVFNGKVVGFINTKWKIKGMDILGFGIEISDKDF